jgi:hypothetical protein
MSSNKSSKELLKWALDLGFATGYADTDEELLEEVGFQIEEMQESLSIIRNFINAYPIDVFPEPDFKRAAEVLKREGMTLDSISASNMRYVLTRIDDILNKAFA